jgi:hypothetical protein
MRTNNAEGVADASEATWDFLDFLFPKTDTTQPYDSLVLAPNTAGAVLSMSAGIMVAYTGPVSRSGTQLSGLEVHSRASVFPWGVLSAQKELS